MKYFLSYRENEKTKQVSQDCFEDTVNQWIEDGYLAEVQIIGDEIYAKTFDNLSWFYVLRNNERQDFDELVKRFKQVMCNYNFDSDLLHDLINDEINNEEE